MEKAKAFLDKLTEEEHERVSRLPFKNDFKFYEDFALLGMHVDLVKPGLVSCSFKVPPRLTDGNGNLASGAIANLVDEVGAAVIYVEGLPMNVSVDMSMSYLSTAKLHDELEITSRLLGRKGGYSGTLVLIKNKTTGEVIAEGRHSLFGKPASKM
ncbi:Thioesterase domain [Dillenia turbinata]|uniref:Acyl-coenzyme A thioesterase 13 n=1 Tax=Dillenia turbinata TaxID=194707 RepID=A0AAN8Z6T9_9MAGN